MLENKYEDKKVSKMFRFIVSAILVILLLSPIFSTIANAMEVAIYRPPLESRHQYRPVRCRDPLCMIAHGIVRYSQFIQLISMSKNLYNFLYHVVISNESNPDDEPKVYLSWQLPYLDITECSNKDIGDEDSEIKITACTRELEDSILETASMCYEQEEFIIYQLTQKGERIKNGIVFCCIEAEQDNSVGLICQKNGRESDDDHVSQFRFRVIKKESGINT